METRILKGNHLLNEIPGRNTSAQAQGYKPDQFVGIELVNLDLLALFSGETEEELGSEEDGTESNSEGVQ